MSNQQFSGFELDQLKEIINIGASHASTALSQLIEKKVLITVPDAMVDKIENNVQKMAQEHKDSPVVNAVILKILGDTPGVMAFILPKKSAHTLARLVTKEENKSDILSELEQSALKEVGNILCGASLSALSRFMDITLLQSVSEVATDTLDSIVSSIMIEFGQGVDISLVFRVSFLVEGEDIESSLYMFVEPSSSQKLLQILRDKLGI